MKRWSAASALLLAGCAGQPFADFADADLLAMGQALNGTGNHAQATRLYRLASERDPRSAAAFRWLGHSLNLEGEYGPAISAYDRALELDPGFAWTWYARGMSKRNSGRLEDALDDYGQAIERDSQMFKAWAWRGFTRHELGLLQAAEEDLDAALSLQPNDAWALFARGNVRRDQWRIEDAQDDYFRSHQLDPQNKECLAQLGLALAVLGREERAQQALEAACEDPRFRHARLWLWGLRVRAGQRARADAALRSAVLEQPGQGADGRWQDVLARLLLGEATLDEAYEIAGRARDAGDPLWKTREFEAGFYAGLRARALGQDKVAESELSGVLITEVPFFTWEQCAAKHWLR